MAFLKNEDELAGLLGHELGHLVAHAQDEWDSQMFREILGMTSVPENENLFDRDNQILETSRLRKTSFNFAREERGQMTADQIGLQAVARAGYVPGAFPGFRDRLMQTKGNTGSWLSDLFGSTNPNAKRLRELLKDLASLPAGCITHDLKTDPQDFAKWQSEVLHYHGIGHAEKLSGVATRETLAEPLRADINNFRFSNDGKYLLAQDSGGIYVLTREPLKFLFRIDAPDAAATQFSSDSRSVEFFSPRLRVETWDIPRQVQINVTDVPTMRGCRQTALSPNARYLACFQSDLKLVLFDVATGERL